LYHMNTLFVSQKYTLVSEEYTFVRGEGCFEELICMKAVSRNSTQPSPERERKREREISQCITCEGCFESHVKAVSSPM